MPKTTGNANVSQRTWCSASRPKDSYTGDPAKRLRTNIHIGGSAPRTATARFRFAASPLGAQSKHAGANATVVKNARAKLKNVHALIVNSNHAMLITFTPTHCSCRTMVTSQTFVVERTGDASPSSVKRKKVMKG